MSFDERGAGLSRRDFVKWTGAAGLGLGLGRWAHAQLIPAAPGAGRIRHICLIMTEDMGVQIGPYGDHTVPTPALDRLAREGCTFTNAWTTAATCSPARASLFTGLYPHQHGHYGLAKHFGYQLHDGVPNYVRMLRDAGYATGLTYKIHVAPESDFPFDRAYAGKLFERFGYHWRESNFAKPMLSEFLTQHHGDDQPFYFQAQTVDTHRPHLPKWGKDVNQASLVYDGSPYRILQPEQTPLLPHFGPEMPRTDGLVRDVCDYYNAVQRVDRAVELYLKALEDAGVLDETLVIFTSDHGPAFARGKLSCYQLGLQVPMIVRWPGVAEPGSRCDLPVSLVDLLPTFLDVAHLAVPDYIEGRSLRGALAGDHAWRRYNYAEFIAHMSIYTYWPSRAIRGPRYKLIWNLLAGREPAGVYDRVSPDVPAARRAPKGSTTRAVYDRFQDPPRYELYDLQTDPHELHDLGQDPAHAAIREQLKAELEAWMRRTADPFLDTSFLSAFTAAYRAKEREVEAWSKEHGKPFWGKPVLDTDQSRWRRPWHEVEAELRRARRQGG